MVLKRKYPLYYLWSSPLFATTLFKDFESRLLKAIDNSDGPFHTSQRLQMAMPEMNAAVKSGFDMLLGQMKATEQAHASEIKKLNQTVSDFFAFGNAYFNSNPDIPISQPTTLSIDPSTSSPTVLTPSVPLPSSLVPAYTLNRKIVTVTDVWREYNVGLPGCPAVKDLERDYGTNWRKLEHESKYFRRRNEIYTAIKRKAEDENKSCEIAAERLEETRKRCKLSLHKLRVQIKSRQTTNL